MNNEETTRATAGHIITLYDSGVLKDQIAEMMDVSRNDVDDIITHREVLGR